MKDEFLHFWMAALGGAMLLMAPSATASNLAWSDPVGAPNEGWYRSSWYGNFYNDESFGQWIWHSEHGWQYIDQGSTTDGMWLWDCEAGSWLYTAKTVYPCLYSCARGAWLYYTGGVTPQRGFWDYNGEMGVPVQMLAPTMNGAVTAATLDAGNSTYNLFDDWQPVLAEEDLSVGNTTGANRLVVQNGSVGTYGTVKVGAGSASSGNLMLVSGAATEFTCGSLVVGSAGNSNNRARLCNMALVKASDISVADNCYIAILYRGFVAVTGDQTDAMDALVSDGKIFSESIAYTFAKSDFLPVIESEKVRYYSDDDAAFAATGHHGLGGCTVVSTGNEMPDVAWALAADENGDWWYVSPWYGSFYTDVSYGRTIWHSVHGWQTIYATSTAADVELYDSGTASNWAIVPDSYPSFYLYETGRYYTYVSGTTPNRVFHDLTDDRNVTEAELAGGR